MINTVNEYDFIQAFNNMGRGDQFSYEGLKALFAWIEEYEEGSDTQMELDVIALCCDFTEYDNLEAFQSEYGEEYETLEDIENNTILIPVNKEAFIIQAF